MNIVREKINNVDVVYIKTDRFKSVAGALYFKSPIEKEKVTSRMLLRNILLNSCKKYDTNRKLNLNCMENYDSSYFGSFFRRGNYLFNSIEFSVINDKYIDDPILDKVIDTFNEIVFNPNIKNNKFDSESFDLCYKKLKEALKRKKENPDNYCMNKLFSIVDKDKAYSFEPEISQLEKINEESLYKEYNDLINNSEVSLYLIGDFDYKKVADKITSKIKNNKVYDEKLLIENELKKEMVIKDESLDINASVLTYALKCKDLTDFERVYVMPIYCNILGGGASSRCFEQIREENSLAYYAYSSYMKTDGLLTIIAGIQKENYEKTKDLMIDIQKSMNEVSDFEIEIAKKDIITILRQTDDYMSQMLDVVFTNDILKEDSSEKKIENFNKVSKEELKRVHEKVYPDSIFFLRGDK